MSEREEIGDSDANPGISSTAEASESVVSRLQDLHAAIDACTVCSGQVGPGYEKIVGLRRGVPGQVVVIGEQPGSNEVARIRAFAGPVGKTLDRWLVQAGALADDPRRGIYMTSLIKCVAPRSATAYRRMVHNCRPFMAQQLALLRPRLVITLGRHAYEWFREEGGEYQDALCALFTSTVDPILNRYGIHYDVMPWPHPSPSNNALLTSPLIQSRLEASFRAIRPYIHPGAP